MGAWDVTIRTYLGAGPKMHCYGDMNNRKRSADEVHQDMTTPKRWVQVMSGGYDPMMYHIAPMMPQSSSAPIQTSTHKFDSPTCLGAEMTPEQTPNDSAYFSEESPQQKSTEPTRDEIPESEVYSVVPGRLTLVGNLTRYKVTYSEMKRRLGAPEYLNSSKIGGLLRKAKTRDGGSLMRQQLKERGIEVAMGKRKGYATTCFTSLTEGEATSMGGDFETLTQAYYPMQPAQNHLDELFIKKCRDIGGDPNIGKQYARMYLEAISEMTSKIQPEVSGITERLSDDPALNVGIELFSRITHGFGDIAVRTCAQLFEQMAKIGSNQIPQHQQRPAQVPVPQHHPVHVQAQNYMPEQMLQQPMMQYPYC
ncbi:unnamed protein product [Caenorhabditis auriculariae]|uniref:Transcription factor AP-2 C-terminal domain-containing protein n=1 Tax=Caenorhabditis auriculariae TaxID=2777116 RepID=A0A8S1HQB9_9PELO|nr:unnamed protein product [Caenorhabditis auriculariae]